MTRDGSLPAVGSMVLYTVERRAEGRTWLQPLPALVTDIDRRTGTLSMSVFPTKAMLPAGQDFGGVLMTTEVHRSPVPPGSPGSKHRWFPIEESRDEPCGK